MTAEEKVKAICDQINEAVADLIPLSYTGRRQLKASIEEKIIELKHEARLTANWHQAANFSGYVANIRNSLNALCAPRLANYRGDEHYTVEIRSATHRMRHPTCLDLGND